MLPSPSSLIWMMVLRLGTACHRCGHTSEYSAATVVPEPSTPGRRRTMPSFSGLAMLFAQAVLAVVFSASLLSKLRDPGRFRRTVAAFDILPYSWSAIGARALTA